MAKKIMIQGTMSNVGKSFITTGLCRIFRQDGLRVAPFKSQNMALNSFVTPDGLEIGRAQAVQAEACGIRPSADMNPILLKPSSDIGSQVVLHGVPIGDMSAREYFSRKKSLIPEIMESFRRLDEAYDVIVIEGAGSPAEINLKQDDIVNMGLAKLVDAPVLLTGDIDRGGVFAQLYGTVRLLEPDERAMIGGLIINQFRGDVSLLTPGIGQIEELLHIPVLGVVPHSAADIDDEDSLSERLSNEREGSGDASSAGKDVAVIRFPHISNFTDFHVLELVKGLRVRYVEEADELGKPDLVILPGSKNTIQDFLWMRQTGIERLVRHMAREHVPVFGICGGFQMMGKELHDPEGTEGGVPGRILPGMGLVPIATVFSGEKIQSQVRGHFGAVEGTFCGLSGMAFEGYQLHMGISEYLEDVRPDRYFVLPEDGPANIALGYAEGNICGTYIHGIFDAPGIAQAVSQILGGAEEKNGGTDYRLYREEQYDRLARILRETLDMGRIRDLMGLEKG